MLTQKRKLRDRKQKFQKVYLLLGLILLGGVVSYIVSLKVFPVKGIISPLASVAGIDSSFGEDEKMDVIRQALTKDKREVKSIRRTGESFVIQLENDAEIVLSAKKDLSSQISSLQFILQRLTMEGRRFSRLDLTFDKPVIVLEK